MVKLSQFANIELGEAFLVLLHNMVVKNGIPYSNIGNFDFVSPSWRKLVNKENKSDKEINEIDKKYKMEIFDLADSCALYIASKTNNKTYQFTLDDYKVFLNAMSENKDVISSGELSIKQFNDEIENKFYKIANHGEKSGDNIIDPQDIASLIYALDMRSQHDENDNFSGFYVNGSISPMNYAIAYNQLKVKEDNLTSLKLRLAYKYLYIEV